MSSESALRLTDSDSVADITGLADQKYVLLTTFRRNGAAIASPMWVVRDGDRLAVCTRASLAKIKRVKANPKVTLAPCTLRGKLLGESVSGHAQVLSNEASADIRARMKKKYGLMGWLIIRLAERRPDPTIAIRITLD